MNNRLLPALLLLSLCGCFKTKDELTLNADGSGSVRLETRVLVPSESLSALGMGAETPADGETLVVYPPTSEAEARRYFPARDFTVTAKQEPGNDSGSSLVINASFKDVNALLASPYGRAHGLTLKIENGALRLQAVLGIEPAARLAETKDDAGLFGEPIPGLAELKKKKDEMRAEFRVTLPGAVTSAGQGGARDGRSVTWIVDRAKHTNAAEFAQQAGAVLEAACSADGLKFKPVTPARLGMLPFQEAPSGALGEKSAGPDAQKIAAAAKFVPYALQVTRTLDLSGDGGSGQNQAQLVGAVVLPRELAPQKWGELKIEEILDAKGTSLKLAADENSGRMRHFYGRSIESEIEELEAGISEAGVSEADDDETKKQNTPKKDRIPAEHRHLVTMVFQSPDWKSRKIAKIQAAINLQYFGGAQVIKLSNAIPANWIREMKSEDDFDFNAAQKPISDPSLVALGLSLSLTLGVTQGSFTSLSMQVESDKLNLTDAQAYDADGRPWPTFFQKQPYGGANSVTVMIPGKPRPPLSLALVASSVGASVDVPILLEKVPVGGIQKGAE